MNIWLSKTRTYLENIELEMSGTNKIFQIFVKIFAYVWRMSKYLSVDGDRNCILFGSLRFIIFRCVAMCEWSISIQFCFHVLTQYVNHMYADLRISTYCVRYTKLFVFCFELICIFICEQFYMHAQKISLRSWFTKFDCFNLD